MKFFDRLLTIVITATITSLLWIVFGGTLLEMAQDRSSENKASGAATSTTDPALVDPAETNSAANPGSTSGAAPVTAAQLIIPVEGVSIGQIEDTFLQPREGQGLRPHEALDIAAARGTPVVAAAAGTIAKLHNSPAGGNSIYLRTPGRDRIHFYAHLDSYAPGLREGQQVRAGQRLGTVGSTGNASEDSPHLHFAILETTADAEWWEPANAVNPYPLLRGSAN